LLESGNGALRGAFSANANKQVSAVLKKGLTSRKQNYIFDTMTIIYTNRNRPTTRYRRFTQPSLTVPDQTMSLKILVKKYVNGLPIAAPVLQGMYTEDTIARDFSKLDLADQEQAVFNASDELLELKRTMEALEAEEAAKALEKAEKDQQKIKDLESKIERLSIKNP
jgi:hypothetical protein